MVKKYQQFKSQKVKVPFWLIVALIAGFVVVILFLIAYHVRSDQYKTLAYLQSKVQELVGLEKTNGVEVVTEENLYTPLTEAHNQIKDFNLFAANDSLNKLKTSVTSYAEKAEELIEQKHTQAAAAAALAAQRAAAEAANAKHSNPPSVPQVQIPILMYHKPPADFDAQMATLKAKGYTTVHMNDVANYFAGRATLPAKPAVVTFDDGFAVQQDVVPILQKYGTKVTLYLIQGGALSHYCIGLLRVDGSQCGDAYLHPDNVKQMMQTGLIEIGDHTVDHPNLATMTPSDQIFQIFSSKSYLENTFGQPITTIAYPYGSYNGTTVQLVSQAGYSTAVTTEPGILQNPGQPFLLHRVRDTYSLP